MKICLTLDDFSILNNRLDLLWRLREHFPNFKVSLFTVPDDINFKDGNRDEAIVRIKECLDWIQIIPHGLHHDGSEAREWSYDEFRYVIIPKIEKAFEKDGLPFEKGFKAPHWNWNKEVVKVLDDLKWFGAVSPRRRDMPTTKRFYIHDRSIDNFPLDKDLKLQGHINEVSPDRLDVYINNLLLLKDPEWCFATDFINEAV